MLSESAVRKGPEGKQTPKTLGEYYFRLLGLDRFPGSPRDMPSEVFLPPELLGSLENAVIGTSRDGLERGQNVYWYSRTGRAQSGPVILGDDANVNLPEEFPSHLLTLHTHPPPFSGEEEPIFSDQDVAVFRSSRSLIELLGASEGIAALFRTGEAHRISYDKVIVRLKEKPTPQKFDPLLVDKYEQEGLAYYTWKPSREKIRSGDLRNGLRLSRVLPR